MENPVFYRKIAKYDVLYKSVWYNNQNSMIDINKKEN